MTIHIVKVNKTNRSFRLVIPSTIIQLRRWQDVKYVAIDDHDSNHLVIRRFLDDKALKTDS